MQQDGLVVYGQIGSAALEKREDLFNYSLQVEWEDDLCWRLTLVTLPSNKRVHIDQFVFANFKQPRPLHPEYALAIELLIANAVAEAKRRGFRVTSVELGVWAYRTIVDLGKRITKVGLPEPILLEDGRTLSRTGYMWVDLDSEGVSLRPWANGDQLIRLVDDEGRYYVPVDDDFGDAKSRKTLDWKRVHHYKALDYDELVEWGAVPLLDEADEHMPLKVACDKCLLFYPEGTLLKDAGSKQLVCGACRGDLAMARRQAEAQGWDYDRRKPLRLPEHSVLAAPKPCAHVWGQQAVGSSGHMKITHECIMCGEPNPAF